MKQYRVFLSYRGNSDGMRFCKDLYDELTSHPNYRNKYGEVYFSPESERTANFDRDIPIFMEHVKHFVMPLTENYFDDFWDYENNCIRKRSITYKEINAAIERNAHFICVSFPNYTPPEDLMWRVFKENEDVFRCAKRIEYTKGKELEVFDEIKKEIAYPQYDQRIQSIAERMQNVLPNVYLATKGEMEDSKKYPFYERLHGVKRIYALNFAGTSFINSTATAQIYEENDWLKKWFFENLRLGKIRANVILTNPHSAAAKDAADYKMYPEGPQTPKHRIISDNLNELFKLKHNFPQIKLNVFLTQISLPYGIMLFEYDDPKNNHMKIDLYAAVLDDDRERPSFILMEQDPQTKALYDFFKRNLQRIRDHYSDPFSGHPIFNWLFEKPIIHRGRLNKHLLPHTKRAFEECIQADYPMEIDLLQLKDKSTIIVGREDQDISQYGFNKKLSECSIYEIHQINQRCGDDQILTLEEFLDLVNGRVPLLLEIKTNDHKASSETRHYVEDIMKILRKYLVRFISHCGSRVGAFAIHSSNPYVLREIKMLDCLIPCGIISTDFSKLRSVVGEEFYQMHSNADFFNIVSPDFVSYDVRFLGNGIARRICREHKIPLLAWTIKDEEAQIVAEDSYRCDNIIIEEATSYRSKYR